MPHQTKNQTAVVPAPCGAHLVSTKTTTVTAYDRPDGWHTRRVTTDSTNDEKGTLVHEVIMDSVRDVVDKKTGDMVHEHVTKGVRDTLDEVNHVHTRIETVDGERDNESQHKHETLRARSAKLDADNYHTAETTEAYNCEEEGDETLLLEQPKDAADVVKQEKEMLSQQLKAFGPTPLEERFVSLTRTSITACDRPDGWHVRRVTTDSMEDESGKKVHEVVTDAVRDTVVDESGAMVHEHVSKGVRDTVDLRTRVHTHVEVLDRERDDELHSKHETLHRTSGDLVAHNYQSTVTTEDYNCEQEFETDTDVLEVEDKQAANADADAADEESPAAAQANEE